MISSGTTAMATNGDAAITLLTRQDMSGLRCTVMNESAVPGFFSVDGGQVWGRLPAGTSVTVRMSNGLATVQVKRVAGGSDVTGLWAWAQ